MTSSGNSTQRSHILIVEDSLTQSMLLQHLLEAQGYKVTAAASGTQALEALAAFKPALIISDIVMPEMDGFELSRRVKSDKNLRDIPVILLTALSDSEDVIRGMEALVDFYLTKPYDEDFLLSKVEAVMAGPVEENHNLGLQKLKISLWGKNHEVSIIPELSLGLLASTYENAIQINRQLHKEIAERKRVEEELRVTVKRLKEMESIIEISPAVAFVRRAEENWPIEFVSDNVLQFDYESEDLLAGQIKYIDIIHPEDRERVLAEVGKYSQDKDTEEFSQEYRINTGYGDVRWVDDRTFVRRNSKGVVTHYQGIILDVTERKLGP
ncbi:MAG: response regulator [Desulfomonile tiedjei]|uniref:Response regulator n=1 Tax=Desulfomonile tiedjei TaxID=2358 RepID=A0A9D6YZJ7_9BACT|nr:response regulator [Desulfomonile tiedjei]